MANTLGAYNPIFYANQTLLHLRNKLGLAGRIYRGYEQERRSFDRGQTITVRKPSTFTAQNAPSTAQDLNTSSVNILLDTHREVKYILTDKERAWTDEVIVTEHIEPAAYALANDLDQSLATLFKDVPYTYDYGTAIDHTILTGALRIPFDNAVPIDDGNMHFMVNGLLQSYFQNSQVFHSAQITGGVANQDTLLRGTLGTRFGVEVFGNQNTPTHAPGTAVSAGGDTAGAVNNGAGYAVGITTMAVDGFTGSETVLIGDTFGIAGQTQKYVLTANSTWTTGAGNITFAPGLVAAVADNAVVTFTAMVGTESSATTVSQNLMFHRNFAALAIAPLPDDLPGADAFTATDPISGITVRARRFYVGDTSTLYMALDILYGKVILDRNMATRVWT